MGEGLVFLAMLVCGLRCCVKRGESFMVKKRSYFWCFNALLFPVSKSYQNPPCPIFEAQLLLPFRTHTASHHHPTRRTAAAATINKHTARNPNTTPGSPSQSRIHPPPPPSQRGTPPRRTCVPHSPAPVTLLECLLGMDVRDRGARDCWTFGMALRGVGGVWWHDWDW